MTVGILQPWRRRNIIQYRFTYVVLSACDMYITLIGIWRILYYRLLLNIKREKKLHRNISNVRLEFPHV